MNKKIINIDKSSFQKKNTEMQDLQIEIDKLQKQHRIYKRQIQETLDDLDNQLHAINNQIEKYIGETVEFSVTVEWELDCLHRKLRKLIESENAN